MRSTRQDKQLLGSPVLTYVTDEVRRQGHDVAALDGIERVAWMLNAWRSALLWAEIWKRLDICCLTLKRWGGSWSPRRTRGGAFGDAA